MHRPQKLVAAFFSAALLCTTGIALADKGGNHGNPHGGPPGQSGSAPGQSSSSSAPGQQNNNHGPGGIGGPMSAPGQNSSHNGRGPSSIGSQSMSGFGTNGFQGSFSSMQGTQATITLANGTTRSFTVSEAVIPALKKHEGAKTLVFFTNERGEVTAVSAIGETMTMRVASRSGNTFTLQSSDGQSRLISLDNRTASRLHVKVGSNLQITTQSANGGRILALDMVRAHANDKFSKFSSSGRGTAFARQAAQLARFQAEGKAPPGLPHQCINPAGNTRGWCKSGSHSESHSNSVAKLEEKTSASAKSKSHAKARGEQVAENGEVTHTHGKCGESSSRNGNPAFAGQMAKAAANAASGHTPPGLPHQCVNPAGNTRGFCKSNSSETVCGSGAGGGQESSVAVSASAKSHAKLHGNGQNELASNLKQPCPPGGTTSSTRTGNPAFAGQMAKAQANIASGHTPPGLPHQCVNPAGNTRGFCKSRTTETSAMCGSAGAAGESVAANGGQTTIVNGAGNNGASGSGGAAVVTPAQLHGGIAATRGESTGTRGPGAPLGAVPGPGGQFARGGTRGVGVAGAPTHVLGAAVGPAARRARATRVLPVAIQPVGKRRCVWYKTGVLAASTGPYRIVGTSAISGKPKLHKKCR